MDDTLRRELALVGFHCLAENWERILKEAARQRPSYVRFLQGIVHEEYHRKTEKTRLARLKRAKIPQLFVMDTFPFHQQPRLKKQLVLELYDSLSYMNDHRDLIFIGPTGCGKTGLATAFLVHAVNHGYRGLFIDFSDLLERLYRSRGDYSEAKIMKKYCTYDLLVIDEIGYIAAHREQAGLFFDLMRRRHQHKTTILTTQLGFDAWGGFLQDEHLTAALLDRITVNCAVFNMKDCISIRPKNIVYATSKQAAAQAQKSPS